jgi:hypothetical protein
MSNSPLTAANESWTRPSYERRVRGTVAEPTYLWGSAGIKQNFNSTDPLVLHVRNGTFGQAVSLGTQVAAGGQTQYGSLQPAECISIPLQGLSGVFATCDTESVVACVIAR